MNSNLPIQINDQSLSKLTFQRCCTDIILSNKHRIQSLTLSNLFIIDYFFSSIENISIFFQLQAFTLNTIELTNLEQLLTSLAVLPSLSSLTISTSPRININTFWNLIFQLPTLKYFKISDDITYATYLPISINKVSSIEHLIMNSKSYCTDIDAILSCVPQLRRLSINYLYPGYRNTNHVLQFALSNLTHVCLKLDQYPFHQFETFVKDYLSQVKVLRISSNSGLTYLNAERWEKLIVSHMPSLEIFDLQHISTIL
ncbi:unnamed protein product, partial [Rotaria sp. Silwood2]